MAAIKEAASEFLACKRVAVTGVSREPKNHGSNVVYKRLRDRGYEVFAVNPNAEEVEGDPSYHDLRSIPGGVEAVVIGNAAGDRRADDARVRRPRDQTRLDAPGSRRRQRLARRRRLRARAGHTGDRRRLPVHVRADRRRSAHRLMRVVLTLSGNVPKRV